MAATTWRLLTKDEVLLVFQREKGKLSEIERLPHTLGNPRMVKTVDLDGNGVADLAMLDGGNDDPIRVRFATEKGQARPRGAVLHRTLAGLRLRSGRRQARLGAFDDREPVGPDPGPLGRRPTTTTRPARGRLSFYPAPRRGASKADRSTWATSTVMARWTWWRPTRLVAQFIVYRQSGKVRAGRAARPTPAWWEEARSNWPTSTPTARPRSTSSPRKKSNSAGASSRTAA